MKYNKKKKKKTKKQKHGNWVFLDFAHMQPRLYLNRIGHHTQMIQVEMSLYFDNYNGLSLTIHVCIICAILKTAEIYKARCCDRKKCNLAFFS